MKRLLILGASGSIGTQTLDVISKSEDYVLKAFSVGHQADKIEGIIKAFPSVEAIALLDVKEAKKLRKIHPEIKFYAGEKAAYRLAKYAEYDTAVNAIVGFAGLRPTLAVLKRGKTLCLANKESLVVGGELVKEYLSRYGGIIYPIDSEHAAIAKCLSMVDRKDVEKIILTASGGPFRKLSREELEGVTPEMALKHPTWKMGKKITIDSSTMMNKGFEVIEACYLFDVDPEEIEVVIHPESLVHSGLRLKDGSYIVDYGKPDMRGPIAYALSEGTLIEGIKKVKSLDELEGCHFLPFDGERFPLVPLAKKAYSLGGNAGAILNGANEMAVNLFLNKKIAYRSIEEANSGAFVLYRKRKVSYHFLARSDKAARRLVRSSF